MIWMVYKAQNRNQRISHVRIMRLSSRLRRVEKRNSGRNDHYQKEYIGVTEGVSSIEEAVGWRRKNHRKRSRRIIFLLPFLWSGYTWTKDLFLNELNRSTSSKKGNNWSPLSLILKYSHFPKVIFISILLLSPKNNFRLTFTKTNYSQN